MNEVSHTLNLTIQSHTISKTAVLGVFLGLFGLWWGTRCPQMCDLGSPWMGEKKNHRGVGLVMNRGRHNVIITIQNNAIRKNGQGTLLRQIMILHRKWLIEKSKKISCWQNQFRGMWCSWKCKIHLHFPERLFDDFQIFFYIVLLVPKKRSILFNKGKKKFIKTALLEWVTGWSI